LHSGVIDVCLEKLPLVHLSSHTQFMVAVGPAANTLHIFRSQARSVGAVAEASVHKQLRRRYGVMHKGEAASGVK
jgi:hypothetical protein